MNFQVYKITSPQTDKIYIGSTYNKLNERLNQHKTNYKRFLNGLHNNVSSFEIVKFGDCIIELLENVNCNNKKDLLSREGYYIKLYENNVVNIHIAGQTGKEYYINNKEKINEKQKEYREKNKEKLNENKKEYYEKNKQKINENRNQKFNCFCGGNYTLRHKAEHLKTKKHQDYQIM